MEKETHRKSDRSVFYISLITVLVVLVNGLFLTLSSNSAKAIRLLESNVVQLEQEARIVKASEQLYEQYQDEISIVSSVFPNEETVPQLIQSLEGLIRAYSETYSVKFNSLTPLQEQEKLFLLLTITLHTDLVRLLQFMDELETYPYLTHVTSIIAKTPDGYSGVAEVIITLKVYVQNPFNPA